MLVINLLDAVKLAFQGFDRRCALARSSRRILCLKPGVFEAKSCGLVLKPLTFQIGGGTRRVRCAGSRLVTRALDVIRLLWVGRTGLHRRRLRAFQLELPVAIDVHRSVHIEALAFAISGKTILRHSIPPKPDRATASVIGNPTIARQFDVDMVALIKDARIWSEITSRLAIEASQRARARHEIDGVTAKMCA